MPLIAFQTAFQAAERGCVIKPLSKCWSSILEIKSKKCCAVCKLCFQTEVAKLLREYCYKGNPKVIAFTVIIQLTFLWVYKFPSIFDSVFYLCFCWRISFGEKNQLVLNLFLVIKLVAMRSCSLSNLQRCRGDYVIICTSLVFVLFQHSGISWPVLLKLTLLKPSFFPFLFLFSYSHMQTGSCL